MTIPDLIDEILLELGSDPKAIEKARQFALGMHPEYKERANQELSETEVEHYRSVILLFCAAIVVSPEFREKIKKETEKRRQRN